MASWNWNLTAYLAFGLVDALLLVALVYSIFYLRRKHPDHVFTIWYAFSLSFTLFTGLFYYVAVNQLEIYKTPLRDGSIISRLVIGFQEMSMNGRSEELILASTYLAVLLPQCMSYLLSGVFGCASRLVLVERVTALMMWLGIKFLAVLSGILMAQAAGRLYAGDLIDADMVPLKLLQSIFTISLSFISAGILYFTYDYRFKRWLVKKRKPVKPFTRYMRHCSDSTEAKAARAHRYDWLRKRVRNLITGVMNA